MKKIYIVRKSCVLECKYNFRAWSSFLEDSRNTAQKIVRDLDVPDDGKQGIHIVYGYSLPSLGKYVTMSDTYTENAFRNFLDNLYKQHSDVMVYAIHM